MTQHAADLFIPGGTANVVACRRRLRIKGPLRFDGEEFTDTACDKPTGCLCRSLLHQATANERLISFKSPFVEQNSNDLGTDVGNH
jgi:hypothetical protein